MVYWRDPDTGSQKSRYFALEDSAKSFDTRQKAKLKRLRENRINLKVSYILDWYLDGLRTTESSIKQTRYHAKHLYDYFGHMRVDQIQKDDIFSFVRDQQNKCLAQLTANRRVTILRAAVASAYEFKIIKKNPLEGLRLPKGQAKRYVPPTPAELYTMVKVAPSHIVRIIYLGYYLGVRVGPCELFSLAWQDVDLDRALIRVWSAKKNKNQPWRDIPINLCLLAEMQVWWDIDIDRYGELPQTIVHWHGKKVSSIARSWASVLEKANIKRNIRPYDLRHAYATEALAAGADIKAVATIMGHAGITTVLRSYQHVRDEQKRKAVDCLPSMKKARR